MKSSRRYIFAALLTFIILAGGIYKVFADTEIDDNPISITVLASSSLTDVMGELARIYSKDKGYSVALMFGPPRELTSTIEEGESADFFISDDLEGITNLKQKGLIDVFTVSNIAQNRLVLAASSDHYLSRFVRKDTDLTALFSDLNEKILLVMGDPDEVPVGRRGREALQHLGFWRSISPYIVRTESSSSAQYLISNGQNAGITYYTDAFSSPNIKILAEFPPEIYSPIIYQAAVVAGLNMPAARDFMDFLKSQQAKEIFTKYGFVAN